MAVSLIGYSNSYSDDRRRCCGKGHVGQCYIAGLPFTRCNVSVRWTRGSCVTAAPHRPLAATVLLFAETDRRSAMLLYSTFDRKLTAVFAALRHFSFLLEGRQFRILTDHKPLVAAFRQVSPPWSARQQRQLAYIAEFTTDIRHTPGADNTVP
jgi:RNase H-like domain found in reverse transcriptase